MKSIEMVEGSTFNWDFVIERIFDGAYHTTNCEINDKFNELELYLNDVRIPMTDILIGIDHERYIR